MELCKTTNVSTVLTFPNGELAEYETVPLCYIDICLLEVDRSTNTLSKFRICQHLKQVMFKSVRIHTS